MVVKKLHSGLWKPYRRRTLRPGMHRHASVRPSTSSGRTQFPGSGRIWLNSHVIARNGAQYRMVQGGVTRQSPASMVPRYLLHKKADQGSGVSKFAEAADRIVVRFLSDKGENNNGDNALFAASRRSVPIDISYAFRTAGYDDNKIEAVVNEKLRRYVSDLDRVKEYLSRTVRMLGRMKVPDTSKQALIEDMIDGSMERVGNTMREVYSLINALKLRELSDPQIMFLLKSITSRAKNNLPEAYHGLGNAYDNMRMIMRWGFAQSVKVLSDIALAAGQHVGAAYYALPLALSGMVNIGWEHDKIASFLSGAVKKAGGDVREAYKLAGVLFANVSRSRVEEAEEEYEAFFKYAKDEHRTALLKLYNRKADYFNGYKRDKFLEHFAFHIFTMKMWKKEQYGIIKGLVEAAEDGRVPQELAPNLNAMANVIFSAVSAVDLVAKIERVDFVNAEIIKYPGSKVRSIRRGKIGLAWGVDAAQSMKPDPNQFAQLAHDVMAGKITEGSYLKPEDFFPGGEFYDQLLVTLVSPEVKWELVYDIVELWNDTPK